MGEALELARGRDEAAVPCSPEQGFAGGDAVLRGCSILTAAGLTQPKEAGISQAVLPAPF